ncbi:MAG: DUF4422 domain-containing protein [Olegusella sp.]|nr:DUF4422 domain-containing protein [Olegusella sp.]
MASDIAIAVASHKAYRMPEDDIYLPLQVGAALHPGLELGWQRDDEGDNISQKNGSYSELTGLYWLWKNRNADYKGLVHYRRLLGTNDAAHRHAKDPYNRLVRKDELLRLLSQKDIIVARRRNYYIETVYNHYSHTFDGCQFDVMREILCDTAPDYVSSWDALMESRGAHIYNMFVMPSGLFDEYCGWMFDKIDRLAEIIGPMDDAFQARYPGRVSERLLDPWLQTHGITYAELPVVNSEPVDWWAKGTGFLKAKFLGKKYQKSF